MTSDDSDKPAFNGAAPAPVRRKSGRAGKSVYEKTRSGSQLASINTVLHKVVSGLGLDRRLRENALISLWPQVVGDGLAAKSRPLFVDIERNLVVAAANGSVAQELSLMKPQLMQKLTKLAASLQVEVKGMRFDLKHFHRNEQDVIAEPAPVPPAIPQNEELEAINLSAADLATLQQLAGDLDSQSEPEAVRSRILKLCERELRIRAWRRAQNYPVCQICGDPVPRLHDTRADSPADNRRVCPSCLYSGYASGS